MRDERAERLSDDFAIESHLTSDFRLLTSDF